ncbi:DUF262 domain-containing protein [Paraburkholderia sp. MMS20-SJTN17]|uniref:DUF262 domain-containing protein n=1 Tax=Paraburkholderia translucens TaxID=2886945 RepID=A0ABS8KC82_9BURK|nr:DUF262 domain-containing protein [Paraburkholderia sp. MMS20-SJTN17]MCC8402027.1 DUF262 domain-containing protein [Paraburkholderia sp. MMS20-SJTN17]
MATTARNQLRFITDEDKTAAEAQVRELQTDVDYETKEYTVELIVQKYLEGEPEDANELFVPAYQRDFVWNPDRQSKFIESVMLGLPIPYVFTASLAKDIDSDEGRVEIVDGSQRIRTLAAFLNDELILDGLEKLSKLNGFSFSDIELSRQRKFKRRPIRVIELSEKATESVRRDIFERINTGSDELRAMEKRKGIFTGPFYDFIAECAALPLFNEVCPISYRKQRREEAEEMVLRYFAYADRYEQFSHSVRSFLDSYLKDHQNKFDKEKLLARFVTMLEFVRDNFPFGFRKSPTNSSVPRVRFEAISVGVTLALLKNPALNTSKQDIADWLASEEFSKHTVSDASNSRPKVKARIEFVRDQLLRV